MHPEFFTQVMTTLYGAHWQGPGAALLDVTRRTLYRWSSGRGLIPPRVPKLLLAVCHEREKRFDAIFKELYRIESERVEAARAAGGEKAGRRPKLALVSVSRK